MQCLDQENALHRGYDETSDSPTPALKRNTDNDTSFVGPGTFNDCGFEINGVPTPTKGWLDDVSTDDAVSRISAFAKHSICRIC